MLAVLRLAKPFLLSSLAAMLFISSAGAAVPNTMSYQGLLTDGAGTPVADGPYDLTLRLYAGASGGAALWTETQSAVPVSKGIFSITLGSVVSLAALPFTQPYWLGVSIGVDPELSTRTALASSPYALAVRTPLPVGSVTAQTILDEPGLAQSIFPGSYSVIGNANVNPATFLRDLDVTITTPGPGYVVVDASAYITFSGVVGTYQYAEYQISESTGLGGTLPAEGAYVHFCGFDTAPNGGYFNFPMAVHRMFVKPSAGAYRFSFCTARLGTYTPQLSVSNLILTATYFPTAYGTATPAPVGPVSSLPVVDPARAGVTGPAAQPSAAVRP